MGLRVRYWGVMAIPASTPKLTTVSMVSVAGGDCCNSIDGPEADAENTVIVKAKKLTKSATVPDFLCMKDLDCDMLVRGIITRVIVMLQLWWRVGFVNWVKPQRHGNTEEKLIDFFCGSVVFFLVYKMLMPQGLSKLSF